MCLLIYKPQFKTVPEAHLMNGFDSNPHGAGISRRDQNNKLHITKGFFTYKEFLERYQELDPKQEMIIHFRFATSGFKDKENCHPFNINKAIPKITSEEVTGDFVMAHNGIFNKYSYTNTNHSDSVYFVKEVLSKYDFNKLTAKQEAEIQKETLGSKVVVMGKSKAFIFGQESGVWDDGIWYSNTGYKYEKFQYPTYKNKKRISNYEDIYEEEKDLAIIQHDSETLTCDRDVTLIGKGGELISLRRGTYEVRDKEASLEEEQALYLNHKEDAGE